jgi:hypothetical protein
MSAVVAILPTARAVDEAWAEYTRLARMVEDAPALRTDHAHQIAIVRAHRRWSDLFNASDRQA